MRDEYQQDKQTMIAQYLCASLLILDRVICLLSICSCKSMLTNKVAREITIATTAIQSAADIDQSSMLGVVLSKSEQYCCINSKT